MHTKLGGADGNRVLSRVSNSLINMLAWESVNCALVCESHRQ